MRKAAILTLAVAGIALSGCSSLSGRAQPDEFAVARNAPLIIPPDYSLTPPVAGTVGLSAQDAQGQAIDTLFGGPAPRSASEVSVLDNAGRDRAALGIRSTVGDPSTNVVDKGAATRTVLSAPEGDGQDATADGKR